MLGRLAPSPPGWSTTGHARVLVIAPHPDDETVGAGGVMALHAAAGDRVTLVVVTDGGASAAGGLSRAEMVARRDAELRRAAAILGVSDVVALRCAEGHWQPAPVQRQLAPLVADADLVYAPSCVDYHPEHVAVARTVATILAPKQTVRVYEVGVPLTPLLVNLLADVRAVAATKARAMAVFATQRDTLRGLERLGRYRAAFYAVPAVEVFWQMRADAYVRLVLAGDWRRRGCPFRGITPRPLSDPACALVGQRERRRLRRLACAR
jgi:LmbE family N-acetylglucosaminyl deacetylase